MSISTGVACTALRLGVWRYLSYEWFQCHASFLIHDNMKDLYVWLKSEVNESLKLLDTDIIKDEADKIVFSSSKDFLNQSNVVLDKLVQLLSENNLDVMKLITLIAKLKCEGTDNDEDDIIQSMIIKMMEISSLEQSK
ncbi:MAG: hypothetical protein PF484_12880 [Bacteroidales bacterium]|jgi:hypothetical protein|nr:hypothetical protein [Bacteroidales bacterium]